VAIGSCHIVQHWCSAWQNDDAADLGALARLLFLALT
jgi:hypothetical protein